MICVYDKRDDFSFLIVKFSFFDGDVLFTPSLYVVDFYIVDISQLDRKRKKKTFTLQLPNFNNTAPSIGTNVATSGSVI